MKTKPPTEIALTVNSSGMGKVSRRVIRERAVELAAHKGRSAKDVSKSDWDQAKRDLTDEPERESKAVAPESAAESERWDPVSGSTGYKVHVPPGDDEDDEGRSDTERLVERGVKEAGRDQRLEAAREENAE